jgi:hypothetical protein
MTQGVKYKPKAKDFEFVKKALEKGATLRSIQKTLGISNNTFKHHFENVESLIKSKEPDWSELKLKKTNYIDRLNGYEKTLKKTVTKEIFIDGVKETVTETTLTETHIPAVAMLQVFELVNRLDEYESINNAEIKIETNTIDERIKQAKEILKTVIQNNK